MTDFADVRSFNVFFWHGGSEKELFAIVKKQHQELKAWEIG